MIYIYILKDKKLNNRGFTLVELLVTIAILGIIAGMSFPMLRKLSEANQQKKYKVYAQSLNSSAKLYVDSYEDDLFGNKPYGCATITYEELKNKLATKDIQTSNLSCFSEKTFVTVRKSHDNYSYYSQIGCGTKKSDNTKLIDSEVTVTYSLGDNTGDCSGTSSGYTLTSSPEKDEDKDKKSIDVNVIIQNSITGINKADSSVNLSYKWTTEKNVTVNDSDWKAVKFNSIPTNSKQEKEILKGNTISIKSNKITTPSGQTGIYYLAIKQDTIYDIYMSDIVKAKDKTTVKYLGPFIIDNTKPVISDTTKISSKNSSYNSLNTTVSISATDNNKMTSNDKLKVCVYESSNSSKKCEYKTYSDSSKASANLNLSGNQDGKTRKIKIVAEDLAGNKTEKTITYTPATKYNITYNLNGGTNAKGNPSTAYTGQEITIAKPTKTVTAKFDANGTGATISPKESKTGKYTFKGWTGKDINISSAKTGVNSANTSWNGSTTTNTKFKDLIKTYNKTVTMSASYKGPSITLPTITKTGYTCKWTDTAKGKKDYEWTSGGTYTPSSATERTFYAYCNVKTIKVTFHKNDGTSTTDTQTFTYGKKDQKFSNKKWTRASYNLLGWSSSSNATTKEYSTLSEVTDNWINNNSPSIDLYAVWQEKTHCPGNICYISSKGNDSTGYGTEDEPYATIQKGYNTVSTGGTISLLTDINQNSTINFNADKKVTLTSNTKSIIRKTKKYLIDQTAGSLILNNITIDGNSVSTTDYMIRVVNANIESGTIIKNANCQGDGAAVNVRSKLIMNGGKISNNKSSYGGSAILIEKIGYFELNGGTIEENSSLNGAIWNAGNFTMTGGTIKNNTSSLYAGGVDSSGTFTMKGGTITGNKAPIAGGVFITGFPWNSPTQYGTFNLYGGTITNNSITTTKNSDSYKINFDIVTGATLNDFTNNLQIQGNRYYKIVSALDNKKVIDVNGAIFENCRKIELWDYNYKINGYDNLAQRFLISLSSVENGTSLYSFLTYAVTGASPYEKNANNGNEIWALDVKDNKKASGTIIQLHKYNATSAQIYQIKNVGGGYYNIFAVNSNQCIDVSASNTTNGTQIELWKKNGANAQKWAFYVAS